MAEPSLHAERLGVLDELPPVAAAQSSTEARIAQVFVRDLTPESVEPILIVGHARSMRTSRLVRRFRPHAVSYRNRLASYRDRLAVASVENGQDSSGGTQGQDVVCCRADCGGRGVDVIVKVREQLRRLDAGGVAGMADVWPHDRIVVADLGWGDVLLTASAVRSDFYWHGPASDVLARLSGLPD